MRNWSFFLVFLVLDGCLARGDGEKAPTVLIVTLIRNKAHTLPYFLSYLDKLDYEKDRISLWIRSDHNEDNSWEITRTWLDQVQSSYHDINFEFEEQPKRRENETSISHWPEERFKALIAMKEEALNYGRHIWADFVFFLDADIFLTNPNSLSSLVKANVTITAPLLHSDGLYSNYWCGMTKEFYYERTEEYQQILEREKVGLFPVPMVHSAILINLNKKESDRLTFLKEKLDKYDGPLDDIIIFAMSANYSNIPMYIDNTDSYGFIMAPLDPEEDLDKDKEQLVNTKLLIINEFSEIPVLGYFQPFLNFPPKDRLSLSKIYMINLWRRKERRVKMENNFNELGLEVDHFPAVDGKQMDEDYLEEMEISFLPGYADPYSKRPMTMGEIGCFLSHYFIWEQIINQGLEEVLILEDDIKFEPFFNQKLRGLIEESRYLKDWDLIYLGRKRLLESDEPWVENSNYLVKPSYSYWTLGYLISNRGARKLLNAEPLQKLVPVDEFLPIMFDKHPNNDWKYAFENRNLNAFSAAPLLLYPTHYTGEHGYISDTEDSVQITKVDDSVEQSEANRSRKQDKGENFGEQKPIKVDSIRENSVHLENHSHEL